MFAVVLLPNFRLQAALRFREEMWLRRPAAEVAAAPRRREGCGAPPQRGLQCPAAEDGASFASQPVALVDANDPKSSVLEINDAAADAGAAVGQTPTQALARCPALTIVPRSPAQEQAAQSALLEIAGTLSPEVEATADGWCTVNLRALREKDWAALGERII